MSSQTNDLPPVPPELVAEVKALVRIQHDQDDNAIGQFLIAAAALCEGFIGQRLIARPSRDILPGKNGWQKLTSLPVQAITSIEQLESDGTAQSLSADQYIMDIDSDGIGWVRVQIGSDVSRMRVIYDVGLADDWMTIPAELREGLIRLAGYLFSNRDGVDAGDLPSVVTALWRPHRRMRMG